MLLDIKLGIGGTVCLPKNSVTSTAFNSSNFTFPSIKSDILGSVLISTGNVLRNFRISRLFEGIKLGIAKITTF